VSRAENAEPRELAVEVCGPALRLRGLIAIAKRGDLSSLELHDR
jgi:hypothetical protein